MKILTYTSVIAATLVVLGAAAFTFAKIQHDPLPQLHMPSFSFGGHALHTNAPVVTTVPTQISSATDEHDGKKVQTASDAAPAMSNPLTAADYSSVGGVPVLMYHYIGDLPSNADATRKDLTVSTQNFAAQVAWLKAQGYQSITMDQLYAWMQNDTPLPTKSVMFTFDDGYTDTFVNAVPILEANHMTGSFGIITGLVGGSVYATWSQIKTAEAGGMEIVSHSYSHPDFSAKDLTDQTYQITKSDLDFNTNIGFVPHYFIYPFGKYDSTTISLLAANGFRMSFTTAFGFVHRGEPLLQLPRVRVHGAESLQTFESTLGVKSSSDTNSDANVASVSNTVTHNTGE